MLYSILQTHKAGRRGLALLLCFVLLLAALPAARAEETLPSIWNLVWNETTGAAAWDPFEGAASYVVTLRAYPEGTAVRETTTTTAGVTIKPPDSLLPFERYYISVQGIDEEENPVSRDTSSLENTSGLIDALTWQEETGIASWTAYRDSENNLAAFYLVKVKTAAGAVVYQAEREEQWIDLDGVFADLGSGRYAITAQAFDAEGQPLTRETGTAQFDYAPHVHDWGPWVVTKAPTATQAGEETRTCKGNAAHTESRAVPAAGAAGFADVPSDSYCYDAVEWAVTEGITTGVTPTAFEPYAPCTRGQVVTLLWRAMGSPGATGGRPFSDVQAGAYYDQAVQWAAMNGVTTGLGDGRFAPDQPCTRAQVITFLWRASGSPAAGGGIPFWDVPANDYFSRAVIWAVAQGITTGVTPEYFQPEGGCSRGQAVTFLYRSQT